MADRIAALVLVGSAVVMVIGRYADRTAACHNTAGIGQPRKNRAGER